MLNLESIHAALQRPWTEAYAKFLAIVLFYGATVHIGNTAELTVTPCYPPRSCGAAWILPY